MLPTLVDPDDPRSRQKLWMLILKMSLPPSVHSLALLRLPLVATAIDPARVHLVDAYPREAPHDQPRVLAERGHAPRPPQHLEDDPVRGIGAPTAHHIHNFLPWNEF